MKQQLNNLIIILLAFSYSTYAGAASANSDLIARVEGFLMTEIANAYPDAVDIKLTVRPPDSRLNFENCLSPTLALHGSSKIRQRMLIRATCSPSFALHLSATVEVLNEVIVAKQAVGRKQTLEPHHLGIDTVNILANQRQHLTEFDQAVGLTLLRSVRAGTPLTAGMVKQPDLVTRGDSVVIVATRGELVVKMPGIAMMTGGLDQQINVKNQSSDRVVKGWVKAPGEVHVPF